MTFFDDIKKNIPDITEREVIAYFNKLLIKNGIFKNFDEISKETVKYLGDNSSFTIDGYIKLYELLDQWFQLKTMLRIVNDEIEKHFISKHYIGKDK